MFFGVLYIIFGIMLFAIPVIGWILGLIFIITGIIKIITGIIDAASSDRTETVTERVVIKEQVSNDSTPKMSMTDELEKLSSLFDKGHITEDEFNASKKKIIQPYSRS